MPCTVSSGHCLFDEGRFCWAQGIRSGKALKFDRKMALEAPNFWEDQRTGKKVPNTYPLVMTNIAMENHYVVWENPLFRLGHFQ